MKVLQAHLDILPEAQRGLWHKLSPCGALGFVLYGGTAIALHLGHRASIDFDFFSHLPLSDSMEKKLLESMPFLKMAELLQNERDTRTYRTTEGVKLSFFGGIGFGRVGEPLLTHDGVLQVASLKDLLAMKVSVIMKRVEAKDYRDIAAILRNGTSLSEGLSGACTIYGDQFPVIESLRTMTYFQGGDLEHLSENDKKTLIENTKDFRLDDVRQMRILSHYLGEPESAAAL